MLEAECAAAGVIIVPDTIVREVSHTTEVRGGGPIPLNTTPGLWWVAQVVFPSPKWGHRIWLRTGAQIGLKICEPSTGARAARAGEKDALSIAILTGGFERKSSSTYQWFTLPQVSPPSQAFREKNVDHPPRIEQGRRFCRSLPIGGKGGTILIDLAPERDITAPIREAKVRNMAAARSAFQEILPKRLAIAAGSIYTRPAAWNNQALAELERLAHKWIIEPASTEGYEKSGSKRRAEVDTG